MSNIAMNLRWSILVWRSADLSCFDILEKKMAPSSKTKTAVKFSWINAIIAFETNWYSVAWPMWGPSETAVGLTWPLWFRCVGPSWTRGRPSPSWRRRTARGTRPVRRARPSLRARAGPGSISSFESQHIHTHTRWFSVHWTTMEYRNCVPFKFIRRLLFSVIGLFRNELLWTWKFDYFFLLEIMGIFGELVILNEICSIRG